MGYSTAAELYSKRNISKKQALRKIHLIKSNVIYVPNSLIGLRVILCEVID